MKKQQGSQNEHIRHRTASLQVYAVRPRVATTVNTAYTAAKQKNRFKLVKLIQDLFRSDHAKSTLLAALNPELHEG
jgi:hypothetical protein